MGLGLQQVELIKEGTGSPDEHAGVPPVRPGGEIALGRGKVGLLHESLDLERTHAERNDALLTSITKETGGIYYRQVDAAVHGDKSTPPLSQVIKSRAEIKLIKGAPDKDFARAQMSWLLGIIAGSLFIEWIVRRLNRLA